MVLASLIATGKARPMMPIHHFPSAVKLFVASAMAAIEKSGKARAAHRMQQYRYLER